MDEVVDGFADELAVAEAEQALGGVVDKGRPALAVDPDDAVAGRVQGETGALLGLAPQDGLARQLAVPNDDHRQDGGDDDARTAPTMPPTSRQSMVRSKRTLTQRLTISAFSASGMAPQGPVQQGDQLRPVGPHAERKRSL